MGRKALYNRDEILEQAIDPFWRNGFSDTSIRQLEEATGLNPGSLYHHFTNKEGIFCAVLEHYVDQHLLQRLESYLAQHSPLEGLRLFFTTSYRQDDIQAYRCGCLLVLAISESYRPALAPAIKSGLEKLERAFTRQLTLAKKSTEHTQTLMDSYLSLQLSGHLFESRKNRDKYVRRIFERLGSVDN